MNHLTYLNANIALLFQSTKYFNDLFLKILLKRFKA